MRIRGCASRVRQCRPALRTLVLLPWNPKEHASARPALACILGLLGERVLDLSGDLRGSLLSSGCSPYPIASAPVASPLRAGKGAPKLSGVGIVECHIRFHLQTRDIFHPPVANGRARWALSRLTIRVTRARSVRMQGQCRTEGMRMVAACPSSGPRGKPCHGGSRCCHTLVRMESRRNSSR